MTTQMNLRELLSQDYEPCREAFALIHDVSGSQDPCAFLRYAKRNLTERFTVEAEEVEIHVASRFRILGINGTFATPSDDGSKLEVNAADNWDFNKSKTSSFELSKHTLSFHEIAWKMQSVLAKPNHEIALAYREGCLMKLHIFSSSRSCSVKSANVKILEGIFYNLKHDIYSLATDIDVLAHENFKSDFLRVAEEHNIMSSLFNYGFLILNDTWRLSSLQQSAINNFIDCAYYILAPATQQPGFSDLINLLRKFPRTKFTIILDPTYTTQDYFFSYPNTHKTYTPEQNITLVGAPFVLSLGNFNIVFSPISYAKTWNIPPNEAFQYLLGSGHLPLIVSLSYVLDAYELCEFGVSAKDWWICREANSLGISPSEIYMFDTHTQTITLLETRQT